MWNSPFNHTLGTMNFFKTKQRTPTDIVRALRDAIPRLESSAPGSEARRKVSVPVGIAKRLLLTTHYRRMRMFRSTFNRLRPSSSEMATPFQSSLHSWRKRRTQPTCFTYSYDTCRGWSSSRERMLCHCSTIYSVGRSARAGRLWST